MASKGRPKGSHECDEARERRANRNAIRRRDDPEGRQDFGAIPSGFVAELNRACTKWLKEHHCGCESCRNEWQEKEKEDQ